MKITIEADPKEIAALVVALQERQPVGPNLLGLLFSEPRDRIKL